MQEEIQSLKARNARVEADKAWETSKTRRIIIAVITYLIVALFLLLIQAPHPYWNALVPVAGFVFSTLTLSFFKKKWIQQFQPK